MGIFTYAFTIAVVSFAQGHQQCQLPTPQVIDWSRVKGEWFNILNMKTPGDEVVKCLQLRNFRKLRNGFSYDLDDYHLHTGTYEGVTITFREKKPGVYYIVKENAKKWMKIVMKDLPYVSKLLANPTLKEAKELRESSSMFYTDYENFLIDFRCIKNGKKYLWVMSRNPHPTAQDVLTITNILAVVGRGWNTFPLYLSGCAKTRYDLSLFGHA